jgi:taurine--2-oxoglutarate transaminase
MDAQTMIDLCKRYTMWSWSAGDNVAPLPITRAEGVHFFTADGRKILDFNSQLMSVLIGHSHPRVVAAIKAQADKLIYAMPSAATEERARLGQLLAKLTPGDIDVFFFTLGGAEANENAIRCARMYTGRKKILSRYRSYHGATSAAMQMTGDPRRWANEPGGPGFIRVMDPNPYTFRFGDDDETKTRNNLTYLEEVIQYEGPDQIAAMFLETVTGTNGILPPPKGYLQGLRKLLSKYGILMVCDEVMAGFGRTGKMFAFQHGDIVPDIVTMAKGLTSSYVPLGAMGVTNAIADHFKKNVFYGGLTYNAHPFALAVAHAVLDVMIDEGLVENAAKMGLVMREEMDRLQAKHPSIKEGRCIGLFGALEFQKNAKGEPLAGYNQNHPAIGKFQKFLLENNLYTITHWNTVMANPPLCITEEQLREAFALYDRGLGIVDEAYVG